MKGKEQRVARKRERKIILKGGQEYILPSQLDQLKTGLGDKGLL